MIVLQNHNLLFQSEVFKTRMILRKPLTSEVRVMPPGTEKFSSKNYLSFHRPLLGASRTSSGQEHRAGLPQLSSPLAQTLSSDRGGAEILMTDFTSLVTPGFIVHNASSHIGCEGHRAGREPL